VASEKEFQQNVRRLGTLVGELEQTSSDSPGAARDLARLLMEVHGAGLERIMELIFDSGPEGDAMISRLSQDPIVRSLLLLYSLHPDDLETRVVSALEQIGPRLHKHDHGVELVSIRDGAVLLEVHSSVVPRGSAAKSVRALIEESIYDLAPDVASLTILGLDDGQDGFVPLERLLRQPAAVPVLAASGLEMDGPE
jgi:hypothetical protein